MIRPRIIPTLLINNGNLVKTKKFSEPRYLGDPINAIRIFNEKFVDELCVLDITASKVGKEPDYELLGKMASEAFMPLSYGGGINTIDQMKQIFRIGFEKIIINTASLKQDGLIRQASEYFGSQSIVCAIDYKNGVFGSFCYINDGNTKVKITPLERALKAEKEGAGEVLLYSINNDGMGEGYDLRTIEKVTKSVTIPVIACGGAKEISDIKMALASGADAVAAGSMFVFYGKKQAVLINYPEEKEFISRGIYQD